VGCAAGAARPRLGARCRPPSSDGARDACPGRACRGGRVGSGPGAVSGVGSLGVSSRSPGPPPPSLLPLPPPLHASLSWARAAGGWEGRSRPPPPLRPDPTFPPPSAPRAAVRAAAKYGDESRYFDLDVSVAGERGRVGIRAAAPPPPRPPPLLIPRPPPTRPPTPLARTWRTRLAPGICTARTTRWEGGGGRG